MRRFIPYLFVATSFLAAAGPKTASLPLYFEPNQGRVSRARNRLDFLSHQP
jgi:hypothetical protein